MRHDTHRVFLFIRNVPCVGPFDGVKASHILHGRLSQRARSREPFMVLAQASQYEARLQTGPWPSPWVLLDTAVRPGMRGASLQDQGRVDDPTDGKVAGA